MTTNIERLAKADLAFQLLAAANYIDALGGDSKSFRAALSQHAAEQEPSTWAQYVAGVIVTYLGADAEEDERTQAIARIIERRLWALAPKQAEQPDMPPGWEHTTCHFCESTWVELEQHDRNLQRHLATQAEQQAGPVGEASYMPATTGFTMACFKAVDVPPGAKLYTHPDRKQEREKVEHEIAAAIYRAGMTLVKTDAGYEVRKFCPAIAEIAARAAGKEQGK